MWFTSESSTEGFHGCMFNAKIHNIEPLKILQQDPTSSMITLTPSQEFQGIHQVLASTVYASVSTSEKRHKTFCGKTVDVNWHFNAKMRVSLKVMLELQCATAEGWVSIVVKIFQTIAATWGNSPASGHSFCCRQYCIRRDVWPRSHQPSPRTNLAQNNHHHYRQVYTATAWIHKLEENRYDSLLWFLHQAARKIPKTTARKRKHLFRCILGI